MTQSVSNSNYKAVTDVDRYVNYEDIKPFNMILRVLFSDKLNFNTRQSLRYCINNLDKDFDILFWLNVKDDDKFKYSYLRNLLIICSSFLNYELHIMTGSKKIKNKYIDGIISPIMNKIAFTLKHYSFFIQLHYNSVKIQRWWRLAKKYKVVT